MFSISAGFISRLAALFRSFALPARYSSGGTAGARYPRRILVKLFHINGVTGFQHQRACKICFPDFFHESGPIHCAFIGQEMFVCLSVIVMYVEGEYPIPMAVQQATVGCRQMVMACIKTKPD